MSAVKMKKTMNDVHSSLSPFYTVRILARNGVQPTVGGFLKIVSYKHAQMPISQVISDHVKLITETNHMHTEKKTQKKIIFILSQFCFMK